MIHRSTERVLSLLCIFVIFCLSGCGDDAWRYNPGIPDKVYELTATQGDQLVSLAWETPNSSYVATSYNVYYVPATEADEVTKTNGTKVNITSSQYVVNGLENGTTYYFMVTAQNRYGESVESKQVSETPLGRSQADLIGTWFFHTLVCGPSAKWERGTVVIDEYGTTTFTEFEDSDHYDPEDDSSTTAIPPSTAIMDMQNGASLVLTGDGAWNDFNGTMGSRKNMLLATWTYSADGSKAITIFQKKRAIDDYDIRDVSGTGHQNPYYPELAGNGPTRYSYHALNSGDSLEWEYSNARVGQQAQFWYPDESEPFLTDGIGSIKDIIYWDYSTPSYKMVPMYDLMWKVTCFAVAPDGRVKEYDSFAEPEERQDGAQNVIFTGRMTDDKTVIVGVSTRKEVRTGDISDQFYLRVLQFNFYPTDQAMPTYTVEDLAGTYTFHEIGAAASESGTPVASWAYGTLNMTLPSPDAEYCVASFSDYHDSNSATANTESFRLSYYPDVGSDNHTWDTFANFVSTDTGEDDAYSRYYDENGDPYFSVYTWWNTILWDLPSYLTPMSTIYYNEHATLSYNRDLLVMTRTDAFGHSLIIGLK